MSKVTSKRQVTVPKRIAEAYAIQAGDEIEWVAAGESIRVLPPGRRRASLNAAARLRSFDQATERQRRRQGRGRGGAARGRGWSREELYERTRAR